MPESKINSETKQAERINRDESEVLRHIALGYNNMETAEKMDISVKTVKAYKSNSMKKLNMQSRKKVIRYTIL